MVTDAMNKKKLSNSILDRPGHPDGMKVPEGYFGAFLHDMVSKLPPNELEQQPVKMLQPPTRWQRIRPFVYMAAMFAGIWCMMKMFSLMQNPDADMSFDRSPVLTAALANEDFVSDYVLEDYGESQLLEDLYAAGYSVTDISF